MTFNISRGKNPIRLRGGRMHNLQNIDLDLPNGKLVVICGVSGSGKTSLAFDTLYAEGQRRYIESFSPYTRQFLPQRDKPEYDRLDHLPAAIAVKRSGIPRTNRSTVGTTAEVDDYLRILFARLARLFCPKCEQCIERHDPSSVLKWLGKQTRRRAMITFRLEWLDFQDLSLQLSHLQQSGFTRLVVADHVWNLATDDRAQMATSIECSRFGYVVVDRIATGEETARITESLETAFAWGDDSIVLFVESERTESNTLSLETHKIDSTAFSIRHFARELVCDGCSMRFAAPEPRLFNFNSSLGACPCCKGLGDISSFEIDKYGLDRSSQPFQAETCPECLGKRLKSDALAFRIDGLSIVQVLSLSIDEAVLWFKRLGLSESEQIIASDVLKQMDARLRFLQTVGLGYLALDRPLRTLSGGEATRVALTTSLGSNLVSMLYVLDEPTIGLHPHDTEDLIRSIEALRDRGNTVIVVEHEPQLMARADWIIEIGPKAGRLGGQVCFQGTSKDLIASNGVTGGYLRSFAETGVQPNDRFESTKQLQLRGATGRNLKNISVEFPLNCLCVVTGVSGSGKSTLVMDTLGAALNFEKSSASPPPLKHQSLVGYDAIRKCVIVDQDPISLSSRSNAATYTQLFDDIRRLFSATVESKRRGYSPSHFSFNGQAGQCLRCEGHGVLTIDMQFLSDIQTTCLDCKGSRYRDEILEVKYRDRSIAECLNLSIEEARQFFRGQTKLQKKFDKLIEIGLGYLILGQSLTTLSAGESQRLKLASYLSGSKESGTLFLMDEPTTGLHFSDIDRLISIMRRLISAGHSLVVIEHNDQLIRAADYLIDLGPGAADQGGQVIATGTPFQIARNPLSITGRFLHTLR